MTDAVRVFLRRRGRVFCPASRGATEDGSEPLEVLVGDVLAGESDPAESARRVVRDATPRGESQLVRRGESLSVSVGGTDRTLSPFLFEVAAGGMADDTPGDPPTAAGEWLPPTAFLRHTTAPGLWESYRRVGPDTDLLRTDRTHGAAWLSVRALGALRDRAGAVAFGALDGGVDRVAETARELRGARPSMIVVRHRIDRVMSGADRTPEAVHDRALAGLDAALDADRLAAERAAAAVAETAGPAATLSRSGTVAATLRRVDRPVVVGESRPGREGVDAAERFAAAGVDATLATDAALPGLVREGDVGCVLLGADRILPSGGVANKVGSYPIALAAADAGVPAYAVAAADKVATADEVVRESGDPSAVYDGDRAIAVENPIFERVPGDLLAGVLTEDGRLDRAAVAARAAEHESRAEWTDRWDR
ncbi:translation initiation factor 2 [Halorubrum trapanicum]|uniref:translation initiation factor 2 n=1 Tax=Halorubrum trapanicum TaxID=29284 RepID=UPI000BBA9CE8|nr:translation initiation factor 2 [Halorubrum trapanicum]